MSETISSNGDESSMLTIDKEERDYMLFNNTQMNSMTITQPLDTMSQMTD